MCMAICLRVRGMCPTAENTALRASWPGRLLRMDARVGSPGRIGALLLPVQDDDITPGLTQRRGQGKTGRPSAGDDDFCLFGQHYSSYDSAS
jgi:hypothetical protein